MLVLWVGQDVALTSSRGVVVGLGGGSTMMRSGLGPIGVGR